MLTWLLLLFAIGGLVSCTGFLVLIVVAAVRFRRRQGIPIPSQDLPPVTLLKPLCGLEPNLEDNLASFFTQHYPAYELIFGTRNADDPALKVVRELQARYPSVPVKIVYSGEPDRPNAKVCSLHKMYAKASYDLLVISDSDVYVQANYVREVTAPLADPGNGMVSCIYRGVPTGGLWSRLEALGMSVEMTSGVVVAELLSGMTFALGPTMAIRRDVLNSIGGMAALQDFCADDYVLGNQVYLSGKKVVLSRHVIDHVVMNRSFRSSLLHQLRWMKSTRFSRPAGHASSVLTFAMPFGVFGALVAWLADMPGLAIALLGWALLNRMIMAVVAGYGVVGDRRALRDCWLYPLRDLMGFFFWCGSYFGDTVDWRGEKYKLVRGGKMLRVGTEPGSTDSTVIAVNDLS